ncbi:MAG: serine--tRNA ligase [Bdellovibrio sp.]|nr:MAG: serine--tRNA ligase [Bdellovibrio sp.]
MIDLKKLEKDSSFLESYRKDVFDRGEDPQLVDDLLFLNEQRKKALQKFEEIRAQQKKTSQEVAVMKRKGEDVDSLLQEMKALSDQVKELESAVQQAEEKLRAHWLCLPNRLLPDVPRGSSEEENKEIRKWGDPSNFSFEPKDHVKIGEALGILDFEKASKISGARFSVLLREGARLERALIQFMMDVHSREHGYQETIPPFIVNSQSLVGTAQFPKFKEDVFGLSGTDYYLIPTAEVPVTNYFSQNILSEKELPVRFVAYSPCFRSEAGSHGRDTKGLIRQHQFNKVELVQFVRPEESEAALEKLTSHAEKILQLLELPYRVVALCSGDIGFASMKTYDLEVWVPSQKRYREISSCSNFGDFQARRANIRFRDGQKKIHFVHTLNGSGLAVGRTWLAILENYQNENGSVSIPKVLQPYMGGQKEIKKITV